MSAKPKRVSVRAVSVTVINASRGNAVAVPGNIVVRGRFETPAATSRAARGARSIAGEVVPARRMALRRKAARAPIGHQPEIARDLAEPLGLAHRRIGRMPEPGARDRLEVVPANLVLVELEH